MSSDQPERCDAALILDAAPDAILVFDGAFRVARANAAADVLFGAEPGTLIGVALEQLVPEWARRAHGAHAAQYLARPRARPFGSDANLVARRQDGRELPVDIALSHARRDGQPVVIAVVRDVTEQRRQQAELDVARRLASVGTLAAGVAHEINNPLSSVVANLAFVVDEAVVAVEQGRLSAGLLAALEDARDGAERIRNIARDLKELSRQREDATGPIDAQAVIEAMLRLAGNELRHRARVVRDYHEVPPVAASEGRLGQVVLNLLINAAQALPAGRADQHQVRVSTRRVADGQVCLEVSDSGPGIPVELRAKLFTPFFTTKAGTGTGLGLTICQQIGRSFGGRIEVDSAPGRGTTFRVTLPAARASPRIMPGARTRAAGLAKARLGG